MNGSLLLLRVRRPGSAAPDNALEVEALLDYETIFPAALTQLDARQLDRLTLAPDNAYGRAIGDALCAAPSVQRALAAIGRRDRVRIQLMIEGAWPQHAVRWERAQLPCWLDRPVALRPETPFSRFAAVNAAQQEPPEDQMFRLLFAVAAPSADQLAPIDAAAEARLIVDACSELLADSRLTLTLLTGSQPLADDARKALQQERVEIVEQATTAERMGQLIAGKHACHIVAHGTFADPDFYLLLEDEEGGLAARPAAELIRSWNMRSLQLMLLQSCQSAATTGANDPRPGVGGFMQQLLEAGVPAVVAMQDTVRMDDARKFSRSFYGTLLNTGLIDEAANQGRCALENTPDYAWSIPAVATRLKQAAIWRESPLRAAARALVERVEEQARDKYPPFPMELARARTADYSEPERAQDELENVLTGTEPRLEADEALQNAAGPQSPVVTCLIAARGRAKTSLLERLYVHETRRHWDDLQPLVPVLLSLGDIARSELDADGAMAAAIAAWFKSRVEVEIPASYIRGCFRKQPFLFLIRGDDDQSETLMQAGLAVLAAFRRAHPAERERHRFLLTLDQNALKIGDMPEGSDWLFVLPMAADRVRRYLLSFPEESGEFGRILLKTLEDNALFDLAEVPWLLSEMLDMARRGVLDHTRARILKRIVDSRISRFPGPAGMRYQAEEVIYRLGWEVMNRRNRTLPAPELFSLLAEVRENRDYSLASFRSGLIDACRMLAPSGQDGARFAYPGFRTYCCAEYLRRQTPERRTALLTDITASLGRRSRLEWWGEPLFVLAGRWEETGELLRLILSGAPLQEGDQLYVAARCLQEARQAFPDKIDNEDPIVRSIISGLIFRSHPLSSRSVASRKEALNYLGPLREPCALRHLVSLVLDPVRPDAQGRLAYDYSGVRLAALKALLYMPDQAINFVRTSPAWASRDCLHDTVDAWVRFDTAQLKAALATSTDDAVTAVAAFAVGMARQEGAFDALQKRFLASGSSDVLWALADSMVETRDPAINEFLRGQLGNADREPYIAYLLGKAGTAAPGSEERKFLLERLNAKDELLRGRCLRSLAELRDAAALASAREWLSSPSQVLCYYALQALRLVGDKDSLKRIEQSFWTVYDTRGGTVPSVSLEQLRLEVYDEIYWRLAGGLSREVMVPIQQKRS